MGKLKLTILQNKIFKKNILQLRSKQAELRFSKNKLRFLKVVFYLSIVNLIDKFRYFK